MTLTSHPLRWSVLIVLVTLDWTCGKNVSTTSSSSSFKDTDVVTAIDQFEAGNLMTNKTRPGHHNYTGPNTFFPPSIIHGFKPVYDHDPQFVSITTDTPPAPLIQQPPRHKPGFTLFKKKKKRPPPVIMDQLSAQSVQVLPTVTAPPVQSMSEESLEGQQRIPIFTYPSPPVPPMSAFSRLTSMFRRGPPAHPPPWRPPQPPVPVQFSSLGSIGPTPMVVPSHMTYQQPQGQQQAASMNMATYARPMSPAFPPKTPYHRISLNHYLQKISNMFSRSPQIPGYRPYAYPQFPAYPHYYPLNTYAPHGGSVGQTGPTMSGLPTPMARRKKLRVKKPVAERRLEPYLTGRPRTGSAKDDSTKPDTMEVKLHTGIHTESRGMILAGNRGNRLGPIFVRMKRDTGSSGYRMPGIFGMDGGKPFYLDKDPKTGDITFTPGQQKKQISSNEVETNGTSDAGGKKKKPMPIIIHSYSTTKMQGQQRRPVNKFVPKKPTFFYGNRTSTLAPPRLPSFYPKVQSLSDFKNSMGIKSTTTTVSPVTTTMTTTTPTPPPTTTTTTTTTTSAPPTTTTEEYRFVTVKASQGAGIVATTFPPGYDPYLPFDLLHLQTKKPDLVEVVPATVQEILPESAGSSFAPTGVLQTEDKDDIVGSVETVPLDYVHPAQPAPTIVPASPALLEEAPEVIPATPLDPAPPAVPTVALEEVKIPEVNGSVPIEGVTEAGPDEYDYDYDPPLPPQQTPGTQYPPYFNPYGQPPPGPPNSFNSFGPGPPGQNQQPPWYYQPPAQQPFYPPWGPYPNPPLGPGQMHPQNPGQHMGPPVSPPNSQPQPPTQPPPNSQHLGIPQPPPNSQHQPAVTFQNLPQPQNPSHPQPAVTFQNLPQPPNPSHPQPPVTFQNVPQSPNPSHPQSAVTFQNLPQLLNPSHPQPPVTFQNVPQSPNPSHPQPAVTFQNLPQPPNPSHPQPPITFQNVPQPPNPSHPQGRPPQFAQSGPNFPPAIPTTVIPNLPTTQAPTTTLSTTTAATTTAVPTTMPVPTMIPSEDPKQEMYETSNESPVSLETPVGPGFNPIQLPNESQRPAPPLPPPPHHFRPPPNFRPPYAPLHPHHFNRYQPPPPFGPPPRQNFPFRPPPPVGDLMRNRIPVPPELLPPSTSNAPPPPPSPTWPLPPREPIVVVRIPERLSSEELYGTPTTPVQTTVTTTTTTEPTTVTTTTTTTTTTMAPPTTTTTEQPPPPTTTTTAPPTTTTTEPPTTTTTTRPTTTTTTTTTTAAPPTEPSKWPSTSKATTTQIVLTTMVSSAPPRVSIVTSRIPPFPPSTEPTTTLAPSSSTASSEYETYYEDYPDEPTVMYNPYNNAQGQYYSNSPAPPAQAHPPPPQIKQYYEHSPAPAQREPVYAQLPDLAVPPYVLQDSLAVESIQKGNGYQFPPRLPSTTTTTTTTQPTTTTTSTTTPRPTTTTTTTTTTQPPIAKVSFKPSQVDNFFISAEHILNEPGSLSVLKTDEDEEYEDEIPTLPNILPQFRPNANVDPSERLPLYGEGEKKVTAKSAEVKVPEGPVEIPTQSVEQYEYELDDNKGNATSDIHNQEITGMLPPPPHHQHPPYPPRPPTPGSFLSNLFYGNKRGPPHPPLPPHVMIGYGNETLRPQWGPGPPPGHLTKFPPNAPFGQGPPPQGGPGQGMMPIPSSVHIPGQGLPPHGFYQPPPGQRQAEPPLSMKAPPAPPLQNVQTPRPHLMQVPPSQGKQQFPGPPPNGYFAQGPPPPHFMQHPTNAKFQEDNHLKRNGQRPPYPPPPPGFFRGPLPPPQMSQPPPLLPTPAPPLIATTPDLRARLESSATSSEEVIYVTQEELEKLKENGQGDEFIEYSDEVEVPADQSKATMTKLPTNQPHASILKPILSEPPKQELSEPVSNPVVVVPLQEKSSRGVPPDDEEPPEQETPPAIQYHQPAPVMARMEPRYSQELPSQAGPQPYFTPGSHQPPYSTLTHAPTMFQENIPPKIKSSDPLDYDDLITGPVVDVTRDSGPRDIIVKSSFSHDGRARHPEKPTTAGWSAAVEKVALDDSIKFMLPGGGTKSSGSIQWGGFQPIS